jgi:hypothetical protein
MDKSEEEEKKKKSYQAIRVVSSRGKSAVVEWVYRKRAYRKIVPLEEIKGGKIDEEVLDKCPAYGVPWSEEIDPPSVTSNDIEIALHKAGVWTAEDAMKKPNAVIGAINAAYKTNLVAVLQAAKKYIKKE